MRSPSIKRLLAAFPELTPEKAKLIKKLAAAHNEPLKLHRAGSYFQAVKDLVQEHCPKTDAHARSCHNDPYQGRLRGTTMCLEAIDEVLGTYGVEPLEPVDVHNMRTRPRFEYLNSGDPYTITLIYKRDTDNLYIGCWGDIAERHPNW